MLKKVSTREWPLVFFTVGLQASCGLALLAAVSDATAPNNRAQIQTIGAAIFPVTFAAILVSMLHLGRPLSAWKSVLNLRRSILSLEVLFVSLFAVAGLAYGSLWWLDATKIRVLVGILTSVLGLAAVGCSARVHMIRSRPVWNSAWVPASFFGTTLLLGALGSVMLVGWALPESQRRLPLIVAAAGSVMLLVAAMWMLLKFFQVDRRGLSRHAFPAYFWLALYLVLAGALPIAFTGGAWFATAALADRVALPVFLGAVVGTLSGRMLMYELGAQLSSFQ